MEDGRLHIDKESQPWDSEPVFYIMLTTHLLRLMGV